MNRTLKIEKLNLGQQIIDFFPIGVTVDNDGDAAIVGFSNRTTRIFSYIIGDSIPDENDNAIRIPLGIINAGDIWYVSYELSRPDLE